jgi:hypothetical protein
MQMSLVLLAILMAPLPLMLAMTATRLLTEHALGRA